MYGIKRTPFYYEPSELPDYYDPSIDWSYWGALSRSHTEQVPRYYNYPHVTALYWTMYRLARNCVGLVANHPLDWYLNQTYQTAVAMTTLGNEYAQYRLMDGSVILEVLRDLQREGLTEQASALECRMAARADVWSERAYSFDIYLLRIGYGGMMGSLVSIDSQGFPSMAFHAFPDTLS